MNVEIGQVWKDIAGGKSRIVEIALASWGIVYIGEPVGDQIGYCTTRAAIWLSW